MCVCVHVCALAGTSPLQVPYKSLTGSLAVERLPGHWIARSSPIRSGGGVEGGVDRWLPPGLEEGERNRSTVRQERRHTTTTAGDSWREGCRCKAELGHFAPRSWFRFQLCAFTSLFLFSFFIIFYGLLLSFYYLCVILLQPTGELTFTQETVSSLNTLKKTAKRIQRVQCTPNVH